MYQCQRVSHPRRAMPYGTQDNCGAHSRLSGCCVWPSQYEEAACALASSCCPSRCLVIPSPLSRTQFVPLYAEYMRALRDGRSFDVVKAYQTRLLQLARGTRDKGVEVSTSTALVCSSLMHSSKSLHSDCNCTPRTNCSASPRLRSSRFRCVV